MDFTGKRVGIIGTGATAIQLRPSAGLPVCLFCRHEWAEARLASRFESRVPAAVSQEIARTVSEGDLYINEYNLWVHHLLAADGSRPFGKGRKLIAHWNLRDEIKARVPIWKREHWEGGSDWGTCAHDLRPVSDAEHHASHGAHG